jgi:glyoxylase-like metal-dependent hydrolase (beta-lactamase superfamily II)
MNRFLKMTLTAALAALLLAATAPAQTPGTASRPALAAGALPPFETARTDANSWMGRFGATNCAWFDMGDGILLLDTGATAEDAKNLLAEAKKTVPGKPVRWVVMTHIRPDANNGFSALLPTDVMLVVNARAIEYFRGLLRGTKEKAPTICAVTDKFVLEGKAQKLEIHAAPGPAQSDSDLWVWAPASGVVYVGDLVTSTRCPITADPGASPKDWLVVLDQIDALHPQALVSTQGPATTDAVGEIGKTRAYLKRTLEFLHQMKAKNAPEARVSGELVARKLGDYCPIQLDTMNVLDLYRRMKPDGTFAPPKPPKPATPKQ